MTVATRTAPNYTTQAAALYKAYIDAAFAVDARFGGWFAPHEQDSGSPAPELSVRVDAGFVLDGSTLTEVAAQTVSGFTIPAAGQHRIDRVVLDPFTGVASRIAGTAATGSPSATPPAITTGKLPICQVLITSADAVITNSMITDERAVAAGPLGAASGVGQTFLGSDVLLNNNANYFDVVNTGSIGASGQKWLLIATLCVTDTNGAATFFARIWDGSTVFVESEVYLAAVNQAASITIMAIVSPSAATTYHLSAKDNTSNFGRAQTTGNSGTANKATSITAIRLQ